MSRKQTCNSEAHHLMPVGVVYCNRNAGHPGAHANGVSLWWPYVSAGAVGQWETEAGRHQRLGEPHP